MANVITKTCEKENREMLGCLKGKSKKAQGEQCFPEIISSQRCYDIELYNLMLVAKGMN